MKKAYLFSLLLMPLLGNAQVINFADPDFKAALLANPSCAQDMMGEPIVLDTNGNGEIEVSEAVLAERIIIHDSAVSDLGGIEFFTSVNHLDFSDCSVTSFNPAPGLPLVLFYCSNNSLTQLDLSMYPIAELVCANNQLTSLILSNLVLGKLDCSNNQLSSLTATLDLVTEFLVMFDCSNNQLETLNVYGDLHQINCQGNQLQELDLSQCRFQYVNTSDNPPLHSITIKNGAIDFAEMIFTTTDFATLPNLTYLCTDQNEMQDFQNLVAPLVPGLEVNTYCSLVPGGTYYNFTGKVRYDFNADGCDASDFNIAFQPFSISNGSTTEIFYTDADGTFSLPLAPGNYTVSAILDTFTYFDVSPWEPTINIDGPKIQDFCFSPNGVHADLSVVLIPLEPARPGFQTRYKLICKNIGTVTQNAGLTLGFDDGVVDFVSSDVPPASSSTGSLGWSLDNFAPFEVREIVLTMDFNSPVDTPPLNADDILVVSATISGLPDQVTDDNVSVLRQTIVNSFDPNDKTCLEGDVIPYSSVGYFVHYLIRFENTGSANAENVIVKDLVHPVFLYPETIVPIGGSHPFTTRIVNGNQLEFVFENINLPFDDAHNDGYVAFKVQTNHDLVPGSVFSNTASIYFDYNIPVITNTATTTVQLLSNPDFDFSEAFTLYPNPVGEVLNIQSKNGLTVNSISIYNMLGQLLMVETGSHTSISVSHLPPGSYFIGIQTDRGGSVAQFIKK